MKKDTILALMTKAKISDLKNHLSHYLNLVRQGNEVEVLDRETPIARIIGLSGRSAQTAPARLVQMEKDGLVERGKGGLSPLLLSSPPGKGARVLAAVLEEREKR